MSNRQPKAILIAGPTASGKSALAMKYASERDGVIVNADSMQVYRELRILTNRPTPDEEARVPHALYGFRPVPEPYSVALWLADAAALIQTALERGQTPVIVGGTGLYFKALLEGLSDIPPVPAEVRAQLRADAERETAGVLHRRLCSLDPVMASRLDPNDKQRIIRALEVVVSTGRSLAEYQGKRSTPILQRDDCEIVVLDLPRDELYARCDARFDVMIQNGAIEEAQRILDMDLDPKLPAMRAVGLPPLLAFLKGHLTLAQAVSIAKQDTRNYAKRQLTWLRGNIRSQKIPYS
jgi:tRNA dimethylallyltransferase